MCSYNLIHAFKSWKRLSRVGCIKWLSNYWVVAALQVVLAKTEGGPYRGRKLLRPGRVSGELCRDVLHCSPCCPATVKNMSSISPLLPSLFPVLPRDAILKNFVTFSRKSICYLVSAFDWTAIDFNRWFLNVPYFSDSNVNKLYI